MESHEENWPLILFTTLSPLSVGGVLGILSSEPEYRSGSTVGIAIVFGVGVLALLASLLHLGHPFRAARAVVNLSGSWLSREVLLFGLFLACTLAYAVVPNAGDLVGGVAVALGLASVLATGRIYQLPSRPSWNHWTTAASFPVGALASGVPLGLFVYALTASPGAAPGDAVGLPSVLALAGLVAACVVTALRLGRLRRGNAEEQASWRLASGQYLWVLVVRVAGAALAFALLLTGGPGIALAWAAATAGELADRVLFFRAVVPVSMPARAGAPVRARAVGHGRIGTGG